MIIGDKDKEGNTLILGGWKANLYLTPEGLYLISDQLTKEDTMALDLYNGLNNTSLSQLPPLPKPNPPNLEGIKLPATTGRVLGAFESQSNPGTYHYVIQYPNGYIRCTCFGYRSPDSCWHYRAIMEIGPKSITETIVVKLENLPKEVSNVP